MPNLPAPEPPPEQVALRDLLNRLLPQYKAVAMYRHDDTFCESDSGRHVKYGWGTQVVPLAAGTPFTIWFDGLDHDIAVWTDGHGWRRKNRGVWFEWRDLTDMREVLTGVEERVRTLLADFT